MTNTTIPEDLAILLNCTHQWPDYQHYQPLSRKLSEIRLLYIHIDDVSKDLHARIHHASLDDEHLEYEAISYCWGPPGTQQPLFINGQKVLLRASLHNFLTNLCNKPGGQSLPIWVDSVCINQQDVEERNHQVALMGRIYSKATQVLVWLGDFTPDADYVFLFLQFHQDTRLQNYENRSTLERKALESTGDIVQRPYWQRLWIVQELVLAKRIQLWSGYRSIKWSDLLQGLDCVLEILNTGNFASIGESSPGQSRNDLVQLINFMRRVQNLPSSSTKAHIHNNVSSNSLFGRMIQFSTQKCHDPRDRVYGLVSLASDALHLEIDYTKTMLEIAFDVVMLTWAHPERTKLYLDASSMKYLDKLVVEIRGLVDYHANMSIHKIDASRTLHLYLRPMQLRDGMSEKADKLSLYKDAVVSDFSQLAVDWCLRLRREDTRFAQCLWQPFQEDWTCFYPHHSTDWPCDNDWTFTCDWFNKLSPTTFVFRPARSTKERLQYLGVFQWKGLGSARSSLAELIAENKHFHAELITETPLDNGQFSNTALRRLEISRLLLFQISLENVFPRSSLAFLELQRSKQWSTSDQLKLPVFCDTDGTARWGLYNHISTSRQYARYQLRDVCHDLLNQCKPHDVVLNADSRSLIKVGMLAKFYRVFRFTGELMFKSWYASEVAHDLLRKLKADGKAAIDMEMDLPSLSLELQDQVSMSGLIVLDQLVYHIGMMRVADHKSSSTAKKRNQHSDSRFEDIWMDLGLCLLSPLLCSVEEVSHTWLKQHDEEYLRTHADWAKEYADYEGNRYMYIRQHFKVWQHYDEIQATLEHCSAD